jgi:serine protease AprX
MPAPRKKTRALTREQIREILYPRKDSVRGNRFTQDTPVTPDVWVLFGMNPGKSQELMLAPNRACSIADLTAAVRLSLKQISGIEDAPVIYNQSHVLARLTFEHLVCAILPLSMWWTKEIHADPREAFAMIPRIAAEPELVKLMMDPAELRASRQTMPYPEHLLHMTRIVGCVALGEPIPEASAKRLNYFKRVLAAVSKLFSGEQVVDLWASLTEEGILPLHAPLWRVYENRQAESALYLSRLTVKADAAARVFDISCKGVRWAVVDSGIDARHIAFGGAKKLSESRVVESYDFTRLRAILYANADDREIPDHSEFKQLPEDKQIEIRTQLQKRLKTGKSIDWDLLEPFLRISTKKYPSPENEHGTHVAGILAANMKKQDDMEHDLIGMCPDLNLYDLRVFDKDGNGDEFVILAALQFIRHLNAHKDQTIVHGVNLSFSLKHSVASYACGSTPVCEEAARLVGSGVVVVAAAGNRGYDSKAGDDGFGMYQDTSITDPGNAEDVITVGATHRQMPHKYGVSYFSSRGPTGDGRLKPDLVAPGEKIESTIPGNDTATLDGTSMAAPHVSGAAALLLARHKELIGQPRRVKEILCKTATDLGRERSFQGAGLLDVLRALQSV